MVPILGWEDPLEEGMVIHPSILACRIPMDRGAWRAIVHGVSELEMTEATEHARTYRQTITREDPLSIGLPRQEK